MGFPPASPRIIALACRSCPGSADRAELARIPLKAIDAHLPSPFVRVIATGAPEWRFTRKRGKGTAMPETQIDAPHPGEPRVNAPRTFSR